MSQLETLHAAFTNGGSLEVMTSFSQYFSILYLFFYTPAFFVDATPIIESAEAGVKLFEVQGHEAVQLQVPSTVSCSSQSGNLTWTKVDEEVCLLIFESYDTE